MAKLHLFIGNKNYSSWSMRPWLALKWGQVFFEERVIPLGGEGYGRSQIKAVLEDVADNLFNPDPYLQQGGDMVRVGGLRYTCTPGGAMGSRIGDMRLKGKPIEADKKYKVAGWAPVAEEAKALPGVKPVWEHVETWLEGQGGRVRARTINAPKIVGVARNPGMA